MLNLLLSDKNPLENKGCNPYCKMAFDGCHLYCCHSQCYEVWKLSLDGKIITCIETKNSYSAICFDCAERCFWALSSNRRNTVFKLNCAWQEIGSVRIPCKDITFSDIAFYALDDVLVLSGGSVIEKMSKSGVSIPFYRMEKGVNASGVAMLRDSLLVGCAFGVPAPGVMGGFYSNACFDYLTTIPKGFSLNSICVGYDALDCAHLFILATQNYQYSYLLEYEVWDSNRQKKLHESDTMATCATPLNDGVMNICTSIVI